MTKLLVPQFFMTELKKLGRSTGVRTEAGGLLLGYRKDGAIQISKITKPSAWDRASPTLFQRSAFGHRISALRAWKKSNGTVDWVGEWHTHPFGSSRPSFIDRSSWKHLAQHTARPMAFIIIGASDMFVGWQESSKNAVLEIHEIEQNQEFILFSDV